MPLVLQIGCFEVTELESRRWRCYNRLTEIIHTTYGPLDEVEEQLILQSAKWEENKSGVKIKVAGAQPMAVPVRHPAMVSPWKRQW